MENLKALTIRTLIGLAISMVFTLPSFAQQEKLTDPEIASVAVTANQIDIDYAAIAKARSKNTEVLKFAETMTKDHKAVIAQATALVKKLKVTPKTNYLTKKLMADAAKTKRSLRLKSRKMFDKAYIDNEVAYHKAVINVVEGTLIPQTKNAELKQLLQKVVPTLKAHLEHAEMVQKSVK